MDGSFGAGVSRASVPLALLSGFIEGLQGRRQVQDQLRVFYHIDTHDGEGADRPSQATPEAC
ncbi:TPA: hypothetical protein QDC03_007689 [Burkholderia cepacia]|nr:hypothetical protein [Burkholderia pyrrocinia]HDR9508851.1 hypothetical protein [Burkholderia cepacia]HDR9512391.1 hypothetical protein [Burkholderia cepacia]